MSELLRYEPITQALVNLLRELGRSAATRNEEQRFVVEGPHLLEEALTHKAKISLVAFTDAVKLQHYRLLESAVKSGAKLYQLSAKQAERVSETEAPQGIFTLAEIPEARQVSSSKFVLVLDAVQDPGNVGTLIRTAAWFGITDIILGQGTADPFNPKVVRGTQGAIFSTNLIRTKDVIGEAKKLKGKGFQIAATTLGERSRNLFTFDPRMPCMVVLGSEARGVREELIELADEQIHIPRLGFGESLNVAVSGGIVMAHVTNGRLPQLDEGIYE